MELEARESLFVPLQGRPAQGLVPAVFAQARLAWVEMVCGPRVVQRVLAALTPGDEAEARLLSNARWCPAGLVAELDETLQEICGRSLSRLHQIGRLAARNSLTGIAAPTILHRILRADAVRELLFRSGASTHYDELGACRGRLSSSSPVSLPQGWCDSVVGFLEEAIVMHGAFDPRVRTVSCQSHGDRECAFELQWC
jgi:hypothetical protein